MADIDDRVEEHRNEALRLLGIALGQDQSATSAEQRNLIAAAQVHAALAQAVAQDHTRRAVQEVDACSTFDSRPVNACRPMEPTQADQDRASGEEQDVQPR